MVHDTSDSYSIVHRCILQVIISRNVISRNELETDILPKLNTQYNTFFQLGPCIGAINNKLRDVGFCIKDINCDDGHSYLCFINTTCDVIANSCSLSEKHMKVVEFVVKKITENDNVKFVDVLSDLKDSKIVTNAAELFNDLIKNHWFYRYRCRDFETIIGGPRLILEMNHWLTNTLQVPECPVCMDPVVGGLHCPHGCGATLHRACAYRSLYSMQSTDDNTNKGICPNCHNQWIVDINNFSENGNIYKN